MKIVFALVGALLVLAAMSEVHAQELCKETCYQWCSKNRPTEQCRADCAGRQSCNAIKSQADKSGKVSCQTWCRVCKSSNARCLDDCARRNQPRVRAECHM